MPRRRLLRSLPAPLRGLSLCLAALLLGGQPAVAEEDLVTSRVRDLLIPQLPENAEIVVQQAAGNLPPCEDPQPFLPQSGQRLLGRVSIGVRCAGTPPQTRYLQATISVNGDYLVVRRAIRAGEIVEPDMLELRQGPLERLPRGTLTAPEQAVGLQAGRALSAGSTLQDNALRRPLLVERNARVTLEAQGAGFVIRREAVALEGGSLDSEVRLRADSGEVLRGRVIGANRLTVLY